MHHFGKAVQWDGYVVRVNLNEEDPLSMSYHSSYMLVKMNNSDIIEGHDSDLGLTFSEPSLERNSDVIEDLHIGDHVKFNATLISLGDRHHLHHLRAFDIKKLDGHMDVKPHGAHTGRYKVKYNNETDTKFDHTHWKNTE